MVAKYVVRAQPWMVVNLLGYVVYSLDKAKWLLNVTEVRPQHPTRTAVPPPAQPAEQIAFLRELAHEGKGLIEAHPNRLGLSPDAVGQVYQFLNVVAEVVGKK